MKKLKQKNKVIMKTVCDHIICKECADLIFKNIFIKYKCPVCRKGLFRREIHALYI